VGSEPDVLTRLAIFPLPDVVLFPGTVLPLHVFEPRYVEMTRDVVAGTRHLAIVRLRRGFQTDYHGRPPIYPIAGYGEVVACQELPGDRFAIAVRGTGRIRVDRELPAERSYREVVATLLPDHPVDEEAVAMGRAQLVAVCERIAQGLGSEGDGLRELVRGEENTARLTLVLASALVRDPDDRQAMLETRTPATRVNRLLDHASQVLATIGDAPRSPN
jgi:Lon protease-like protein